MSKPASEVIIRGLKCDAQGCDFMDEEAVPDVKWLNSPCPKCGANLLTEADLANVRILQLASHLINVEHGPIPDDAKMGLIRAHMDGSGRMTLYRDVEAEESKGKGGE